MHGDRQHDRSICPVSGGVPFEAEDHRSRGRIPQAPSSDSEVDACPANRTAPVLIAREVQRHGPNEGTMRDVRLQKRPWEGGERWKDRGKIQREDANLEPFQKYRLTYGALGRRYHGGLTSLSIGQVTEADRQLQAELRSGIRSAIARRLRVARQHCIHSCNETVKLRHVVLKELPR